ncbi:MAG: glycoside hydrolase family 95 protein [Niabella sp.]
MKKLLVCMCLMCIVHLANAQDLTLWYDKPAATWTEALPVGNGRLGAMLFGGINDDHIQFNEETLWTGGPRDYNKRGAYQYLDTIRTLLFAGRQKEAEDLAGREFMGLRSADGDRRAWENKVLSVLKLKNNPSQILYNDKSWKEINMPAYDGWEAAGMEGMDGAVWFRKTFVLPDAYAGKALLLDLNKIANKDLTYLNGTLIGSQNDDKERQYNIPAGMLKKGTNTIAILVLNYNGKGGLLGYKDTTKQIGLRRSMQDNILVPLNGQWKYFVQDNNVPAVGQYQAAYQPFGDIHFLFNQNSADISGYKRSLDISDAVASVTYVSKGVSYKREYIASAPDQVLAAHFTADKASSISFEAALNSPHKTFDVSVINKQTIALRIKVKDGALKGSAFLSVNVKGGTVLVEDNKIVINRADEATVYLSANTNFKNYKDVSADPDKLAAATISKSGRKTFQQLRAAHIEEYQKYFNTFSISLGSSTGKASMDQAPTDQRLKQFATSNDPSFLALYVQYGRYLLISSSRPGTQPANLQGIWNDLLSPPWGSKYTTNINLEMNYWPADLLHLSPMEQPLFQMIRELSVTGSKTAREYYNAPGWVLHHNTDLWRGTAPINASNHGIWVTGGAWLCDQLWQHYLFTQDKAFLKDTAYPIMKNAALFFNSFLTRDPVTGYLVSAPSNSPEHGGLVAGPTMDHQIIRNLFKSVIAAGQILNTDATLRDTLIKKYDQVAPNQIGKYGQLQEWMQDVDDPKDKHRHVSHLWGVYPGTEINWEHTPDLMKAARQSLIYRGDEATGWSLAWKINLWARFKDGNHTYKMIQMLLRPANGGAGSYTNLFDAHPPFQIDGNFGAAAGVGEMLVQSHTGTIELLPALPDALPDGEIKGICARGGFVLDIKWNKGALESLAVKSNAGEPLKLLYKNKRINISTNSGNTYQFNGSLQQL